MQKLTAYEREVLGSVLANFMRDETSGPLSAFVAGGGRVHTKDQCKASRKQGAPKNCVIHRPSVHKLTGAKQTVRASTLIEDQCQHGIGHPNPDSVAYLNWRDGEGSWGVHGCDRCCGPVMPPVEDEYDDGDFL